MVQLSFSLNKDFVREYEDKKVPWGYVDANGTSVSEITYLRTYSRIKEDGSKERWHETCERVINGTFSLQKDWAKKNRLPWNDNKAQKAAQEAYHNLWSFKWSPPGRGLWAMGTERVHGERGSSTALNNCLRGDTGVITSTGVKKIKDLAGTKPTLLTENGKWIQAPVASFGNQRLMKITLQRAKSDSKVIYATPDHRWFTRHAKRSSGQWTETLTKDLTDKHQLKSVYGQGINDRENRRYNWRVVSVEETDLIEEVFCATVDGTHSFVLEDNILTGNCSVWSTRYMTKDDPSYPFVKLANNSFLGVGVGFDTEGAKKGFVVQEPVREGVYQVPDTREGWAESVGVVINAFLKTGGKLPEFDYSLIRPEGAPIKTFGGIAPGPGPLIKMHKDLIRILSNRVGERLSPTDIVDIANIIGVGVVSGGVRRTALLAAGDIDDQEFIESKDYEKYPYRADFGWMSNNSVKAKVGDDLSHILDGIKLNGEPGILWLDTAHNYGRIEDGPRTDDQKTVATNPCFTGRMCLMTKEYGFARFDELDGKSFQVWNGSRWTPSKAWYTGKKPAYRLTLTNGQFIELTGDHVLEDADGNEVTIETLTEDTRFRLMKGPDFPGEMTEESFEVSSVEDLGEVSVYDFCEPETHWGMVNGFKAHNCGEIFLEGQGELCVSGDTKIHTDSGVYPIRDLLGKKVNVWNGEEWSEVEPFYTGRNELYRVTLSDGSYLDATPGHEWSVKTPTGRKFQKLKTKDLSVGMVLPEFNLDNPGGKYNENAYTYGWVAGDGYIDGGRVMALVKADEYSVLDTLGGTVYKEQSFNNDSEVRYSRVNVSDTVPFDAAVAMRREDRLPEEVFTWDAESVSDFMGGWIDADGSLIQNPNTDHYVLYGSEGKLREAQILLRRIGVNHASLRLFSEKGTQTNKGVRNQDLYRLLIPSYEADRINTRVKVATRFGDRNRANNAHPDGNQIDAARKQKIVAIEKISDDADTFCFYEEKRGMGVFGNVLTYQCCLSDLYLGRQESKEEFFRSLKNAYLYAKTVTLLPTEDPDTNSVIQRNRRIGVSLSGTADFADKYGLPKLREWMDDGYKYLKKLDEEYSKWLCVRESIRLTTIKPGGTTGIVAAQSPGVHWTPGGKYFKRGIVFQKNDPLVEQLRQAGYEVEDSYYTPETSVFVQFPIKSEANRSENEVTLFEKANLAATAQRYWADNSVSVTLSFDSKEEAYQIPTVLQMYEGQLKSVSFLPQGSDIYPQQPYQRMTEEEYERVEGTAFPVDLSPVYRGSALDGEGESYCQSDKCEIPKK